MYTFVSRLFIFPSLTFGPRRRSPAQRSSLTYGYSNDQGILDGSDMESLSRRCSPSESIDALSPSARRLRSHEIFLTINRDYPPVLASSSLLPVNFRLEIVDADATITRRSVSNDLLLFRILGADSRHSWSFKKQRIKRFSIKNS